MRMHHFSKIALENPQLLHECHSINTMLKFIVDFEQDELVESVLYALLNAVDRFTINDNSEPTIIDSVDPTGPAWILVDEGMRERHELIRDIFSVRIKEGNFIFQLSISSYEKAFQF